MTSEATNNQETTVATESRKKKNWGCITAVVLVLLLFWAATWCLNRWDDSTQKMAQTVTAEKLKGNKAHITDWSYSKYGRRCDISDDNGDGIADGIWQECTPQWLPENRMEDVGRSAISMGKEVRVMDEEMIKLATAVLQAQYKLGEKLSKESKKIDERNWKEKKAELAKTEKQDYVIDRFAYLFLALPLLLLGKWSFKVVRNATKFKEEGPLLAMCILALIGGAWFLYLSIGVPIYQLFN